MYDLNSPPSDVDIGVEPSLTVSANINVHHNYGVDLNINVHGVNEESLHMSISSEFSSLCLFHPTDPSFGGFILGARSS
ncbi:hypothetical protein HanXRQr2_Chr05g0214601 [Helianthus annuus]|uniref:Uncharacterized protein n=1 Tax=Helianthus annuus TaxID=4232 RepID=A0A251UQ33_HELAN|nr:hypothetical protein HanXRQr2_Chr05g0214601 [Helianthus annuus]